MTRTILSVGALLTGALVLAGCGGGGRTSGVAGTHHAQAAGSFRASVHGFEAKLQSSVQAFRSGNLSKAAAASSLVTKCSGLASQLSSSARTPGQQQAVVHMRLACRDMSKAANAGMSGSLTKAKQFAREALMQAQIAARLSG